MPDTLNVRPPVLLALSIVVVGGLFYLAGKHIEARAGDVPTITVSGEGKTSVAPDIAALSLGFQVSRQKTAAEAMRQLKVGTDAIMAALKAQGVEEKDIRTEQFNLNPVYDWTAGKQTILGFEAVQSVSVKVRDLDKVSDVLGAATAAGANQSGGVQFTVDKPEGARSVAREDAIEQAQTKAAALAKDLGMRLGRIKAFNESTYGGPTPPMPYMARGMAANEAADASAVQLPAGEQDVNVQVSITYELR